MPSLFLWPRTWAAIPFLESEQLRVPLIGQEWGPTAQQSILNWVLSLTCSVLFALMGTRIPSKPNDDNSALWLLGPWKSPSLQVSRCWGHQFSLLPESAASLGPSAGAVAQVGMSLESGEAGEEVMLRWYKPLGVGSGTLPFNLQLRKPTFPKVLAVKGASVGHEAPPYGHFM